VERRVRPAPLVGWPLGGVDYSRSRLTAEPDGCIIRTGMTTPPP
jgi:hypothetical protein